MLNDSDSIIALEYEIYRRQKILFVITDILFVS